MRCTPQVLRKYYVQNAAAHIVHEYAPERCSVADAAKAKHITFMHQGNALLSLHLSKTFLLNENETSHIKMYVVKRKLFKFDVTHNEHSRIFHHMVQLRAHAPRTIKRFLAKT